MTTTQPRQEQETESNKGADEGRKTKRKPPSSVAVRWSHVRGGEGVPQLTFFLSCRIAHKTTYHSIVIIVAEAVAETAAFCISKVSSSPG